MTNYFRQWASNKYSIKDTLSKAWNDPDITFEDIQVPNMEERKSNLGVFRDPKTEMKTIDYFRAQHELTAVESFILQLVKDNCHLICCHRNIEGYFFHFGREVVGGHLALEKFFNSLHRLSISSNVMVRKQE